MAESKAEREYLSPRAAAKDYMARGGNQRERYPAGISRMVAIAESNKETAAGKMLEELAKLADLYNPTEDIKIVSVELIPIEANEEGKIVCLPTPQPSSGSTPPPTKSE